MKNPPQVLCCPRCGSDEISYGHGGPPWHFSIECYNDECRAVVLDYSSESAAMTRWNRGEWDGVVLVDDDGFNTLDKTARGAKTRHVA